MSNWLKMAWGWIRHQPQPKEPRQYAEDCIFSSIHMYCYNKHKPCYECDCATCNKFIKRNRNVLK